MSAIAPIQRRSWLLATAGLTIALAAIIGFVGTRPLPEGGSDGAGRTSRSPVAADLPQADWEMRVFASGRFGKLTKTAAMRLDRQQPRLTALVRDVYGALFLRPEKLPGVLRRTFTRSSAAAFAGSKSGLPRAASEVRITRRSAQVGVKARGVGQAVASVEIALRGDARGGRFRMVHESTLWLQRYERGWKVIAFEMRQRPRK